MSKPLGVIQLSPQCAILPRTSYRSARVQICVGNHAQEMFLPLTHVSNLPTSLKWISKLGNHLSILDLSEFSAGQTTLVMQQDDSTLMTISICSTSAFNKSWLLGFGRYSILNCIANDCAVCCIPLLNVNSNIMKELPLVLKSLENYLSTNGDSRYYAIIRWLISRNIGVLVFIKQYQVILEVPRLHIMGDSLIAKTQCVFCPTFEGDLIKVQLEKMILRKKFALSKDGNDSNFEKANSCTTILNDQNMMAFLKKLNVINNPLTHQEIGEPYVVCNVGHTFLWSIKRTSFCRTCNHSYDVSDTTRKPLSNNIKRLPPKITIELAKVVDNADALIAKVTDLIHSNITNLTVILKLIHQACLPQISLEALATLFNVLHRHGILKCRIFLLELITYPPLLEFYRSRSLCENTVSNLIVENLEDIYRNWQEKRTDLYFLIQFVATNDVGLETDPCWEYLLRTFKAAVLCFHGNRQGLCSHATNQETFGGCDRDFLCSRDEALKYVLDGVWMLISESEKLGLETVSLINKTEAELRLCTECVSITKCLSEQARFRRGLTRIASYVQESVFQGRFDTAWLKTSRMRSFIQMDDRGADPSTNFPMPLRPNQLFTGINYEKSVIIRSSKYPMLVDCYTKLGCCGAHTIARERSEEVEPASSKCDLTSSEESCKNPLEFDSDDVCSLDRVESESVQENMWEDLGIHVAELDTSFRLLHKTNDDVRQDCFVVDFLALMERRILKHVYNMSAHLHRYSVLPLSGQEGFIEFVDDAIAFSNLGKGSPMLNDILKTKHHRVLFVESLAAYSIVTYILGVGDRHLDNLMLNRDGRMFHVDFGFVLGNDPKPFAKVPMRLTSEMVNALGGVGSTSFLSLCIRMITVWFNLRKQSNELRVVFLLVSNSQIQDIKATKELIISKATQETDVSIQHQMCTRALARVTFFNGRDSILCIQYLVQEVILKSLDALAPTIVDYLHNWVLYFK